MDRYQGFNVLLHELPGQKIQKIGVAIFMRAQSLSQIIWMRKTEWFLGHCVEIYRDGPEAVDDGLPTHVNSQALREQFAYDNFQTRRLSILHMQEILYFETKDGVRKFLLSGNTWSI